MTQSPGYIVVPVLWVPNDPWMEPDSFPHPPDTVHERITDRGAALAVKLVITSAGHAGAARVGKPAGGAGAGLGCAMGVADGLGDGMSVGV